MKPMIQENIARNTGSVEQNFDQNYFFFFFFPSIYLFIFGCVGSLLLHAGFLQLRRAGTALRCGARASHCSGFSCCGAQVLKHRLSSCGAQAQLLRGMWDLTRPGLEPMSPALAGGFLTTAPQGKSPELLLILYGNLICEKVKFLFNWKKWFIY